MVSDLHLITSLRRALRRGPGPIRPVAVELVTGCQACAHPRHRHDTVAERYCAASVANGLDRPCVCRPGEPG
ncbi:hypothetical protein JOF53_000421 [Crossiella equi]|uniref:Uncharacterized protein n=1 Tax=Crossiella equi TaxID=130796 RepID=A0ABS5A5R1_9PSEU|nr:RGCVC family protein [Crossiella equi]MBP2471549.1 hypothetical protein [Crossiella equi]